MIQISERLALHPIQISAHSELYPLIREIYLSAYPNFWVDQGEWYLDLCYSIKNLTKELSRPNVYYFFVEFENEKVGILKYDFPFSPRQVEIPNALKLHRLYLSETVQGTGIAQELMNYVEQIAITNELDNIWLEAMEQKSQAKRFYEKMGFDLVHTYQLDFERLLPEVRGIHIFQKKIKNLNA
jgi:GNAT superfamily N-acetyltransferase